MDVATRSLTVRVGCELKHTSTPDVPAIFLVRPAASLQTRAIGDA